VAILGSCARYELVRNSDLDHWMDEHRPVTRLDELGGDYEVLPAVSAGVRVSKNEVVNIRVQNGGGYGDPLDREPERVLADVLARAVSAEWADRLYGVVVREGELDAEATEARRREARDARRARMPARTVEGWRGHTAAARADVGRVSPVRAGRGRGRRSLQALRMRGSVRSRRIGRSSWA